jgi:hypothetical protein
MNFVRHVRFILLVVASSMSVAAGAYAQTCAPPPGFVDTARPTVGPAEQLASHTEEITVDRPLAVVMSAGSKTSLKDTIRKAESLPGVAGDYPLNAIPFGTPGARRLVCLSDGSTLEEQVLEREENKSFYRFRYIVWNYTTEKARPVEYGIGEFRDSEIGDGHTHIVWTYSFKLKDNEFPGYLGALGRYLFRVRFLDRQYAVMMRGTLEAGKATAEKEPAPNNR